MGITVKKLYLRDEATTFTEIGWHNRINQDRGGLSLFAVTADNAQ
jgi:hypothetical protein